MLSAVIAARGKKYLMMNAPAAKLVELEDLLPGLESPSVIPLAHEGMIAIHSVVGRGRGLGPAAAPEGRRRVGDPRPADRKDRAVTRDGRLTLRRLDLAAAATDAARPRERDALFRRSAVPDQRVRDVGRGDPGRGPRPAAPTRSGRSTRASAAACPTAGCSLERSRARARRCDALDRDLRAALEQAIANVRRFAETQRPATTPNDDRRRASRSNAAGRPSTRAGCYVPGGSAPLPSSLVMAVVPAQVAGVGAIVVASPAGPRRAASIPSCSARPRC